MTKYRIGIDASSTRAGGGIRHLMELLRHVEIADHPISKVVIWGNSDTLSKLPNFTWLEKIQVPLLEKSIAHRVYWWLFHFGKELHQHCDVLLCAGGTFISSYKPYVAMSRNMLVFDGKERSRYGFSKNRLRLILLNLAQSFTFLRASGVIFISKYAETVIVPKLRLKQLGKKTKVIHHGVAAGFKNTPREQNYFKAGDEIRLLYVSSIDMYKHQWNLIQAVSNLRKRTGFNFKVDFIGGFGDSKAKKLFEEALLKYDSSNEFTHYAGLVGHDAINDYYKRADLFIYLSTCENMPNILIEAMSSGVPIATSDFQPMPEFAADGAVYFNPENVEAIEQIILRLVENPTLRSQISKIAFERSSVYNWKKCADETFGFLCEVASSS